MKEIRQIRRGDIYYVDLRTDAYGSEQSGIRPVLVIQNDIGNLHSPTVIVAAITTRRKKHSLPTHVPINRSPGLYPSLILLEQLRTIDKGRLTEYVCTLEAVEMEQVGEALAISVGCRKPEEEHADPNL